MKRKKFLALALAGVMTAATLTACAPLEDLYDWFFGSGSSKASHGSKEGVVTESPELEEQLKARLGLSGTTTANDNAKETLEEVAGKFDPKWLDPDKNELNDKAETALKSITQDNVQKGQILLVDVMKLTSPDKIEFDTTGNRTVYMDEYKDGGSSGSYHDCSLESYSDPILGYYRKDGAELYAGTFQKDGTTYAAMVTIMNIDKRW